MNNNVVSRAQAFEWELQTAASNGLSTFTRVLRLPDRFSKKEFPERFEVVWTYANPDSHDLPSDRDMDVMAKFENDLVDSLERTGHSIFVISITGGGQRQFTFYSACVAEFMFALQAVPHPMGKLPIRLSTESDPTWSYYAAFSA